MPGFHFLCIHSEYVAIELQQIGQTFGLRAHQDSPVILILYVGTVCRGRNATAQRQPGLRKQHVVDQAMVIMLEY